MRLCISNKYFIHLFDGRTVETQNYVLIFQHCVWMLNEITFRKRSNGIFLGVRSPKRLNRHEIKKLHSHLMKSQQCLLKPELYFYKRTNTDPRSLRFFSVLPCLRILLFSLKSSFILKRKHHPDHKIRFVEFQPKNVYFTWGFVLKILRTNSDLINGF